MAKKFPVIILGAGGHALVIWDILENLGCYKVIGLTDPSVEPGTTKSLGTLCAPILGSDAVVSQYLSRDPDLRLIAGVGPELTHVRRRIVRLIETYEPARTLTVIHPQAIVARSAQIGTGTVVMAGAVVNPGAVINRHCVINTGATVDHECRVAENVFIQPGVHLGGRVVIEEGAIIGIGASVRENVRIGAHAYVGGGSFVCRDVPNDAIVVGVPARLLRRRSAVSDSDLIKHEL